MINRKIDTELKKIMTLENINRDVKCLIYVLGFNSNLKRIEESGVKIEQKFPFINAVSARVPVGLINKLSMQNYIEYISSQSKVEALMHIARKVLKVSESSYSGNEIGVAYIDTGIASHPDFKFIKNRIIKFVDLINEKEYPYDDNGHGTFVAGVGSGNGALSGGKYKGIAPNSNIISIKALDKHGEANATKILEAMQWVYDNHLDYNIKVVCMSFGSEPLGYNDPIMKGAEALWKKGIVIVSAAGNSGPEYQTIKSPGISPRIITVGGMNDNRFDDEYKEEFFEIANFSSRGPAFNKFKPDIVAPSVDINSCSNKDGYTKLSGTSVATPMIAGLCALAFEKNKYLRPEQIKRALLACCNGITYNRNLEGYGLPNLEKFLKYI